MKQYVITIVGRNHYQDVTLSPRESIFLKREPENEHDIYAVGAYKNSGIMFGHVYAPMARKLCRILQTDDNLRGQVCSGHNGSYRCKVTIGV